MRTTFNSSYRHAADGIDQSSERLARYQQQVTSGKRIETPREDPSGASARINERAQISGFERYSRAADSVSSRLSVIDTVLDDVVDKISAAQTATVSAMGTTDAARRNAAAQQLAGIRDALFGDVNTSFRGVYLFAGGKSTTPPYGRNPDNSVTAYQGSAAEMEVDIDGDRSVRVTLDGASIVKGSDTDDVFEVLDDLIAAAQAGDSNALGAGLDGLKRAFGRATATQSRVGSEIRTVDDEKLRLDELRRASLARLSSVEDADLTDAISGMTQAETAYRAALGATGTILRVSLLDYLK